MILMGATSSWAQKVLKYCFKKRHSGRLIDWLADHLIDLSTAVWLWLMIIAIQLYPLSMTRMIICRSDLLAFHQRKLVRIFNNTKIQKHDCSKYKHNKIQKYEIQIHNVPGEDIAKATGDWKGLKITVQLTVQNRQATVGSHHHHYNHHCHHHHHHQYHYHEQIMMMIMQRRPASCLEVSLTPSSGSPTVPPIQEVALSCLKLSCSCIHHPPPVSEFRLFGCCFGVFCMWFQDHLGGLSI